MTDRYVERTGKIQNEYRIVVVKPEGKANLGGLSVDETVRVY